MWAAIEAKPSIIEYGYNDLPFVSNAWRFSLVAAKSGVVAIHFTPTYSFNSGGTYWATFSNIYVDGSFCTASGSAWSSGAMPVESICFLTTVKDTAYNIVLQPNGPGLYNSGAVLAKVIAF